MKLLRYGTPNGNIYVAQTEYVATASKDAESARQKALDAQRVHTQGLPAPYTCRLGEFDTSITIKQPMLIVGANNYVREYTPFFIMQKYDIYLFFMPCADTVYKIGAAMISRTEKDAEPIYISTQSKNIQEAMQNIFFGVAIEATKYLDENVKTKKIKEKLIIWHTHWIYRCPKIALRDVLSLEQHKSEAA
jgi:hypothetical protein